MTPQFVTSARSGLTTMIVIVLVLSVRTLLCLCAYRDTSNHGSL
jgi:hypothetical protein